MFHKLEETLKASNPEMDVQVHDSAKLFKQGKELEAMEKGQLDMAAFSIQDITATIPEYELLTQGYLFKNFEHVRRVYAGEIGEEVFAALAKKNILVLEIAYIGMRVLGLNKTIPVRTSEDLANLRLRMPEKDSWQKLGRALGAEPVPVSVNDIPKSYQDGKIDGQDSPLPALISTQTGPYVKQIVLTNHMPDYLFVAISKAKWDNLSDSQKVALKKAAQIAKMFNDQGRMEEERSLLNTFKESGKIITAPDLGNFKAYANAYYQAHSQQYPQTDRWKELVVKQSYVFYDLSAHSNIVSI